MVGSGWDVGDLLWIGKDLMLVIADRGSEVAKWN